MKIISPSFEILTPLDGQAVLKHIEMCGRVCYKSEDKITGTSAATFVANSLKTEVVMTANLREWRHFFKLRTAPAAHPQMRELAIPLLRRMQEMVPVVFDDLEVAHEKS